VGSKLACGVYGGAFGKKVSDAHETSRKGIGKVSGKREEDKKATGDTAEHLIIKNGFGDPLLFVIYEFIHENKYVPQTWVEVFEFLNYLSVKGTLKERAMQMAQAQRGH
jgi:hypothetical protein